MKFGKQFRLLTKDEWADHYVRYKQYKQLLKLSKNSDDEASSVVSEESAVSQDLRTRVGRFSISSEAPKTVGSVPQFEVGDHDSPVPDRLHRSSSDFLSVPNQFLVRATAHKADNFVTMIHEDLERVSSHFDSVYQRLEARFDEMRHDKALVSANDPRVLAFCSDLEELKQFVLLNHTALLKIMKKVDKKAETPLSSPQVSIGRSDGVRSLYRRRADSPCPSFCMDMDLDNEVERTLVPLTEKLENLSAKVARFLARMSNVDEDQARRVSFTLSVVKPKDNIVTKLTLNSFPRGAVTCVKLVMGDNALSGMVTIPVMVARGTIPGQVVGITAALHGNELNGIPLIHTIFRHLDCSTMVGTIVAIPVCNPHGYVRYQRGFSDGQDLNRIMPGKQDGNASQVYAYNFCKKVLSKLDYLIDLHTASFGRVNSYYVRADMNAPTTRLMAMLANPQIIVHNTGPDGSLRGAAADMGIAAITLEIGDPQKFHIQYVRQALKGVVHIMSYLKIIPTQSDLLTEYGHNHEEEVQDPPVVCSRSFWIYSKTGGVLYVLPKVAEWVRRGDVIAEITDVYGRPLHKHFAPETGIVVGKSCNPVCQTGDRILHLGVVTDTFPEHQDDGHV